MPDTDGARCSWNWNFDGHLENGNAASSDPEGYFMRNSPKSFAVWDTANGAAFATRSDSWANPTLMTKSKTVTVSINNRLNTTPFVMTVENDVPSQYVDDTTASGFGVTDNTYSFELKCAEGGATSRDAFPDCFQGEEIHLSASLAVPAGATAAAWTDNMADPWLTEASIADT